MDLYALQPTSKAHCDYFYKESNVIKIQMLVFPRRECMSRDACTSILGGVWCQGIPLCRPASQLQPKSRLPT